MKTYYDILEISRFASDEVLERAHKVLIKKYHPDLETDSKKRKEKEEYIKIINEAYETLSDKNKRKEYDLKVFGSTSDNNEEKKEEKEYQKKEDNIVDSNKADEIEYERANQIYTEKVNEEIRKAQERIDKEEQAIKENLKKYEREYLRSLGYTVYEPTDWKRVGVTILTIIILLIIIWIIYLIPPFKNSINNEINSDSPLGLLFKIIKSIYIVIGSIIESIFKK